MKSTKTILVCVLALVLGCSQVPLSYAWDTQTMQAEVMEQGSPAPVNESSGESADLDQNQTPDETDSSTNPDGTTDPLQPEDPVDGASDDSVLGTEDPHLLAASPDEEVSVLDDASTLADVIHSWDDLKDAVEQATEDVDITIGSNISFEDTLTISHGHTLTIHSEMSSAVCSLLQANDARHFTVTNGALILKNITIDGVDQMTTSGGIELYDSDLTLETGATVTNCGYLGSGGGIDAQGGTILIDGAAITNNYSKKQGGGILAELGAKVIFTSGEISGNLAGNSGGGLCIIDTDSYLEMNGGSIINNSATDPNYPVSDPNADITGYGGGVAVTDGSIFIMNAGLIHNNYCTYSGGGVIAGTLEALPIIDDTSQFTMNGGTISENISQFAGGGVCVRGIDTLFTMLGGSIESNQALMSEYTKSAPAGGYGGGIYLISGTVDLGAQGSGTTNAPLVSSNTAAAQGGGIYLVSYTNFGIADNSILNIYGGTITSNHAGMLGGGICIFDSTVNLYEGLITNNTAVTLGGGVCLDYFADGRPAVMNMTGGSISNNAVTAADGMGGGVCVSSDTPSTIATFNCEGGDISSNSSAHHGGGIYAGTNAAISLSSQSSVVNNSAAHEGGGIYSIDFTGFAAGATAGDYSGVKATDYANLSIDNTVVFAGNLALAAYEPPSFASTMTNLAYASTSISLEGVGYIPLLNNYDINYAHEPVIETYRVVYLPNGGVGGDYSVGLISKGTPYLVLPNTTAQLGYTRSGYTFEGWSLDPLSRSAAFKGGEAIDDSLAIDDVVTLYAVWKAVETPPGVQKTGTSPPNASMSTPKTYDATMDAMGLLLFLLLVGGGMLVVSRRHEG